MSETTAISCVKNRRVFTIFRMSLWKLLAYFILYSIVGYVIETLYGVIAEGVLESRQNFLYGPFCSIYGLGAVVMIVFLQYFKKNKFTLFCGGIIVGSITEYLVSLIGEWIFHMKWWDYSGLPLNINGRICLIYSVFWGVLSLVLMSFINPKIDKLFTKIQSKINIRIIKSTLLAMLIFLLLDYIISSLATTAFFARVIVKNDLDVPNKTVIERQYDLMYSSKIISDFIYKFWGNEKMLKTFPNLRIQTKDDLIYIRTLFPDIQPYYLKIYNSKTYA